MASQDGRLVEGTEVDEVISIKSFKTIVSPEISGNLPLRSLLLHCAYVLNIYRNDVKVFAKDTKIDTILSPCF